VRGAPPSPSLFWLDLWNQRFAVKRGGKIFIAEILGGKSLESVVCEPGWCWSGKSVHAEGFALAKKSGKVATAFPARKVATASSAEKEAQKAKWLRQIEMAAPKSKWLRKGSHSYPTFYFYYSKLSGINMESFFNREELVVS
jgi:hypothetical protein